jgi:hypothetical protein
VLKEILRIFGIASGLVTNISKCFVALIHCKAQDLSTVQEMLPCNVVHFPCSYLGLPFSVWKITKADIIALIDKIDDRLPRWKAALMHQARRATMVKLVLIVIPIYRFIVLHCPKWVLKSIDKIRRGFLWKGQKNVMGGGGGGHCLVGWERVCRSLDLSGLGIHNLEFLGSSLILKWLWKKKICLRATGRSCNYRYIRV